MRGLNTYSSQMFKVCQLAAGSAGGLAKNFATLVDVLGEFGEVTKPQQERAQVGKQSVSLGLNSTIFFPQQLARCGRAFTAGHAG